MHLLPMYLYLFERHDDYANMDKYHIMDCIECGRVHLQLPRAVASDPLLPYPARPR